MSPELAERCRRVGLVMLIAIARKLHPTSKGVPTRELKDYSEEQLEKARRTAMVILDAARHYDETKPIEAVALINHLYTELDEAKVRLRELEESKAYEIGKMAIELAKVELYRKQA